MNGKVKGGVFERRTVFSTKYLVRKFGNCLEGSILILHHNILMKEEL